MILIPCFINAKLAKVWTLHGTLCDVDWRMEALGGGKAMVRHHSDLRHHPAAAVVCLVFLLQVIVILMSETRIFFIMKSTNIQIYSSFFVRNILLHKLGIVTTDRSV